MSQDSIPIEGALRRESDLASSGDIGSAAVQELKGEKVGYDPVELLKLMYLSREGDRREGVLHRQSKGWFQVAGMGHETLAVIALAMEKNDYLFPYYRDRAMVLARGVSNAQLASAYFAKAGSSSKGRQMPGHYSDRSKNVWSVPTPTGANALPGCGVAWAMQLEGKKGVVVATVGDAASRQGEFHEAISFAVERNLPIVFVVEDNNYGISTNTEQFNPFKLEIYNPELVVEVDARHPDRLHEVMSPILEKARSGGGPTVVVCELDRLCSHTSSDDHRVYRPQDEIDEMYDRDPIDLYSQELIAAGKLTDDQWKSIREEINQQVDQEYIAAENEPDPKPDELMHDLLAPLSDSTVPPLEGNRQWRMVDAINHVFKERLATDSRTIFFGEDIEAPKGGVFGLTNDLSADHPERAFNSPLAEATIVGVGIGMACYGMRPVFEIQFIDFCGPAMNQISQNLGTLRWRTGGDWNCPMVLYAPYGAYLPGGSLWHSQANESMFAHMPGMRVVVPGTPEDAAGLMWTAMNCEDPTIFLVPKHLFRQQMQVGEVVPVPFGKARIRQEGDDVTIVTWGNCIEQAFEAAKRMEDQCDCEIIDLRSVQPWDRETVLKSIEKTGRLVIVQEDGRSCSVGQMIITDLLADEEGFYHFVSPPQLVSKPDVHIGYNPIYEYAALPDADDVVKAIEKTLQE
jgi:2-oxoisovalerate dehydrogenase E1 component